MFEGIQDWLDEREEDAVYQEGLADGEAALRTEELVEIYEMGYTIGHGDVADSLDEIDD